MNLKCGKKVPVIRELFAIYLSFFILIVCPCDSVCLSLYVCVLMRHYMLPCMFVI